jgi:hypothetical protein
LDGKAYVGTSRPLSRRLLTTPKSHLIQSNALAADPCVVDAQCGHRLHGDGDEVLRAIAELDEGEERVSWRVGIVWVLLWPLDGLCIGGNLPSPTFRPMVGIRLLPHRSHPRLAERFPMDPAVG